MGGMVLEFITELTIQITQHITLGKDSTIMAGPITGAAITGTDMVMVMVMAAAVMVMEAEVITVTAVMVDITKLFTIK